METIGRAGALLMLSCGLSYAQDYPSARLLHILTSQSGSGSDVVARILIKRLPDMLGQNAIDG